MIDYAFHLMLTDLGVANFDTELGDLIAPRAIARLAFTTYNIKLAGC
jgi:hypothetical protein